MRPTVNVQMYQHLLIHQGVKVGPKHAISFMPTSDVLSYSSAGGDTVTSKSWESRMSCGILPTSKGSIDDVPVSGLRDTRCTGVVVRKSLVSKDALTGNFQRCVLADGS